MKISVQNRCLMKRKQNKQKETQQDEGTPSTHILTAGLFSFMKQVCISTNLNVEQMFIY